MPCCDVIAKHFLILGLLTVITLGLAFPAPGVLLCNVRLGTFTLSDIAIDIVFVISGVCLDSVSDALQTKALTLGVSLVLLVTPLMAIPILWLSVIDPSLNQRFLQGMALFCIVPTTLSSGVTMITQAKGNVSLAILLTSVTNVLGVFTMPWSASWVFSTSVAIDPLNMFYDLVFLTLVPLCVGICLRQFVRPVRNCSDRYRKAWSIAQNTCILCVIWLMVSKAQHQLFVTSSKDLWLCVCLSACIHLTYRLLGYFAATAARLPPREWVTIVLMGSQKSLPVAVSVLAALPSELRRYSGLFILPCVLAHAAQLVIDSMLAVRWEVQAGGEKGAPLLGRQDSV